MVQMLQPFPMNLEIQPNLATFAAPPGRSINARPEPFNCSEPSWC